MRWSTRLQNLDSRLLYLLLALVVCVPLLINIPAGKAVILPQSQVFFNTVERIAADPVEKNKLVIFSFSFSSSTSAENLTQAEAVMRHLMAKHLKFAIFAFNDPQGRDLGEQLANKLAPEYGYQYGRDYVNWGYKAGDAALNLKSLVQDIPGTIGKDVNGTPLAAIPAMKGIRTVNDVSLVVEITSVSSLESWIGYFTAAGAKRVPLGYGCTAVMAPEAFPYLKSGQISGLLVGLKGAAEYESLVYQAGYAKQTGFATRASASLSFAHFLILILIILGNAGMIAARREAATAVRVREGR